VWAEYFDLALFIVSCASTAHRRHWRLTSRHNGEFYELFQKVGLGASLALAMATAIAPQAALAGNCASVSGFKCYEVDIYFNNQLVGFKCQYVKVQQQA
jgi:hypothetical protein